MRTAAADFLIDLAEHPERLRRFSAAPRKVLAGVEGLSEPERRFLRSGDPVQVDKVVDPERVFAGVKGVKKKGPKKKGPKKK